MTEAEQKLGLDFKNGTNYDKHIMRSNQLDFKEVFKWIVSPLLAKELGVPANLDGSFLVNCSFLREDQSPKDNNTATLLSEKSLL